MAMRTGGGKRRKIELNEGGQAWDTSQPLLRGKPPEFESRCLANFRIVVSIAH